MRQRFDKLAPGLHNKVHLCIDLVLGGLGVEAALRHNAHPTHLPILAATAIVTWLAASGTMRLYSPNAPRSLMDNLVLRFLGTVAMVAALHIMAVFVPWLDAQQVMLGRFAVFFFVSTSLTRALAFRPLSHLSAPSDEVLIVGTGDTAKKTFYDLSHAPMDQRAKVLGFVALEGQPNIVDDVALPVFGSAESLLHILGEHPVTEVYIAARVSESAPQMQAVVDICERVGMPFALPLHSLRFERAQLLGSQPLREGYLHYMSTAQKPVQYAAKRLMDIVASALALIVLSPLLLGVALGIKLTSRGPVLFKQKRVGLHGATFDLLKYRSMVTNAEELKEQLMKLNEQTGPVFKMANDPRITGIGHFIRKYSIDELPQLINILRGDMTIVGPRPAVPKEVVQYKAWQRRRLSVRPGLTCYWQVSGRNSIGFEDWMRLDLRYVDNWNFGVDIELILRTIPAVFAGKGAS